MAMQKINYLSVCSGIEAATVAWEPLGFTPIAFSEVEPFPCALLKHHYPSTPNWGDMTNYEEWPNAAVDVLVGGTPCQSFSLAGLRKGLDDPRGNLMLTYLAIARRYSPRWLVWENVPGVLSSGKGRDFGALLGGLAECGYGFAYRILDAQYFGVPQRRRRVFVVGHFGNWRRAAAVLFERHSMSGDTPPRQKAGQRVAPTISVCPTGGGGPRGAFQEDGIAGTVTSKWAKGTGGPAGDEHYNLVAPAIVANGDAHSGFRDDGGLVAHALSARHDSSEEGVGRGLPLVTYGIQGNIINRKPGNGGNGMGFTGSLSPTLTKNDIHAVAYGIGENPDTAHALRADASRADKPDSSTYVRQSMNVRRLTPRECERLQGFPDDYTAVPFRGKPASDSARYKALGNSMAVPVMRWIGERMKLVDAI